MIEVFLNELSLHAQFRDFAEVADSLIRVNSLLTRISELATEKRVFFDPKIYNTQATGNRNFSSCLEHITDKSARLQFKLLMRERLGAVNWRDGQLQAMCSYVWDGQEIAGSSVAELAERSIQRRLGFLLNFSPSNFPPGHCIQVQKELREEVTLSSVNSGDDLDQWCEGFPELGLVQYDPECGRTPLDEETILRDRSRFQKTALRNQNRCVYIDRKTNFYLCVDNLHRHGAHLEVFDANGDHIGEATLDGVIDTSKADTNKNLHV
jgi:hypothetical protein